MLNYMLTLTPMQEFFLLASMALILLLIGKQKWLPEKLRTRKLPTTLAMGAVGIIIPGGVTTFLIILYVWMMIFMAAMYALCPACWDKVLKCFRR